MKTGSSKPNEIRLSKLTDQQLVLQKKLTKAKKERDNPKIKKFQFHLKQTSKGLGRIMASI